MTQLANKLGTEKIGKLLVKQAVPATIGILVVSFWRPAQSVCIATVGSSYCVSRGSYNAINSTGWWHCNCHGDAAVQVPSIPQN